MRRANILFFKAGNKYTRLLADIAAVHKQDSQDPSRYFDYYRSNSTQQKIHDITEAYMDLSICEETTFADSEKVRSALCALLHTKAAPYETKVYQLRDVGSNAYKIGSRDDEFPERVDVEYWRIYY